MAFYRLVFDNITDRDEKLIFDVKLDEITGAILSKGDIFGKFIEEGESYPCSIREDGTIDLGTYAITSQADRFLETNLLKRQMTLGVQVGVTEHGKSYSFVLKRKIEL